ncbi:probable inactive purple acid phosphatase 27 isoform X2 [Macadamia integrifolia]|uniref:probable inactive purple acid phosphatase 27 isoform X2 n=1 Tax=Macadamia integrifolia TaxID=60698 RepID=UPI001C529F21|nr:probable inactive purple acid phosphatase 27 isoform X2 [Macadamia integrifolia]
MYSFISFNFSSFFFTFFLLFGSLTALSPTTSSPSSSSSSSQLIIDSTAEFQGYTAISEFRLLNRRTLFQCIDPNPFLQVNISAGSGSGLSDDENVTVTVSGVLNPSHLDWVAMISPSSSSVRDCPLNKGYYIGTGDISELPLLCHYPVKAQLLSNDPDYMGCKKQECKRYRKGICKLNACVGSLTFHVINIRTDIEFVFFTNGFDAPCILKRTGTVSFANPKSPLYGHLSNIDSKGESMRLTWASGDQQPQQVQYGNGQSQTSQVATFTKNDMWSGTNKNRTHHLATPLKSPAADFGWHDPGYIHSAVMTGLQPSTSYSYRYGSDSVGWSDKIQFRTPPAGGSPELKFIAFGDMGKAPRDGSAEHYIQKGSISVVDAMAEEVASGNIDSIFHIGDISYATGFLVEWDFFLHQIMPVASHISYMTAIGNHERDYINSGSVYITPDSGGECGVAYETYFPMPTSAKDKPWYSIEQGPVHFTVISTEHNWSPNSEQYLWMEKDLASVDRSRTPWLIFTGHRPMYSSIPGGLTQSVDPRFVAAVEPLLINNKVDLAMFGHVHNYERMCAVYQNECKGKPTKDTNGTETYDNSNYNAPVHVIIGMAGFALDKFPLKVGSWSLVRISQFGYTRFHATKEELKVEFVNSEKRTVEDSFRIIKS